MIQVIKAFINNTPTRVKNREDTIQHFYVFFCQNNPRRQATSSLHRLVETPYLRPRCEWTNCAYTRAYAHPSVVVSQIFTVMSKSPVEYTHLHALVPRTPVE